MTSETPPDPRCPTCAAPVALRDRLQAIATRMRDMARELGGDVMIRLPSALGDREGTLLALANELEDLVK
jgi:hypothetical protein